MKNRDTRFTTHQEDMEHQRELRRKAKRKLDNSDAVSGEDLLWTSLALLALGSI